MAHNVSRHAIADGDYTLEQIQKDHALGVLLSSAGSGYVTRVVDGWATPVRVSENQPPAPVGAPKKLSYQAMRSLAKERGYDGASWTRTALSGFLGIP